MPSWTADARVRLLPNGLTLVVQPVADLPAAAVVSRVAAGFFDEPDDVAGIAHVLEHMFFKGTPTRGVGEIARATKALGGYLNAGTSYDYTAYYVVLPARSVAEAVAIQADALRHPLIDAGELAREIEVIVEEARRKLDTPSAVVQEALNAELFDRHRIRRWRIGHEEVLRRLNRDTLLAYYRTRYVPSRTVVAVAGGVDAEATLALLESHYGDWTAGPAAVDPSPAEPPRRERRARTIRGDIRQPDLVIGWRGVPALHPDAVPLDLAAAILGAGRASRLYQALREPGVAGSVGVWSYSPTEVGIFAVTLDLPPDRLAEALGLVAREVRQLAEAGPGPGELERARTLLRARWARRFESAEGRAMELASAVALSDIELVNREYQRLLATTAAEVREAVARHLDPEAVAAVAYLPHDRGADLTVTDLAAAFGAGSPVAPRLDRGLAWRPASGAGRRILGVAPEVQAGVHHLALPGGDLLVRRHAGAPLVALGLYRPRLGFDPPDRAGLAALAVRSALRGAGALDAVGLAEAFERLGGTLSPSVTAEWYGYQTSVLPEHLDEAAALLDLALRFPTLPAELVRIEQGLLADDAAQIWDDMVRRPTQLAARAAFGEIGYGLPLLGTPDSVRAIAVADVQAWHREQLGRGRTTVVAVGDLEPQVALQLLAHRFAHLEQGAGADLPPAPPAPDGRGPRQLVEERQKAQTAMAMLFPGPDRLDPLRHAAEVWSAVAGGLGGRLFEALRDRRSLAYTVSAYPWQRRRVGGLVTYIATSPSREAEARDSMLSELAAFRTTTLAEEEVARAARYLAGQTEVARQRAGAVLGEILEVWLEGEGLGELEDPAAPFLAVTAADVREVAERYLVPELRAEGVVRGSG